MNGTRAFLASFLQRKKRKKKEKKGDESQLSQSWGCRSLHFDGVGTVPGLAAIPWIGTQVGSSPGDGDLSPGFGFWALYRAFSHHLGWAARSFQCFNSRDTK